MMEKKTKLYSVASIEKGTVIDHIDAGSAMKIVELLGVVSQKMRLTLGLNLKSRSMGLKDLIKVEGRILTEEEASKVALFAPKATINLIEDYQVVKKFKVTMPKEVEGWISCPNPACITHHENVISRFQVLGNKKIELKCRYCDRRFSHDSH